MDRSEVDKERVMGSGRAAAAWIWRVELGKNIKHYLGLPLSGIRCCTSHWEIHPRGALWQFEHKVFQFCP